MKRILSLILAISLVLALVPSIALAVEAAPAGSFTLTFGEGGITNWIKAPKTRATYSITDGEFSAKNIRTDTMACNHKSSYTIYVAFQFIATSSGMYELNLKTDNPTKYSANVSVYFYEDSQCAKPGIVTSGTSTVDYSLSEDNEALVGYFVGASNNTKNRIGQFHFGKATKGEYKPVAGENGNARVSLEKDKTYYVILYCDDKAKAALVDDDPETEENEANKFKSGSYEYQEYYLSGIRFDPVTEMHFGSAYIDTNIDKIAPAEWTVQSNAGWIVDAELARTTNYGNQRVSTKYLQLNLARSSSSYEPWSAYSVSNSSSNNSSKARQSTFMMKTNFAAEEGYYRIKALGGKINSGAKMAIYADNKFAGWYECYDEAAESPALDEEKGTLNTIYLTPGADGKIPVMIASESIVFNKVNDDTSDDINRSMIILSEIEFEYLGKEKPAPATPDKIVVETAPTTLEAGASAPISAYVRMSDGSKRHISGLERAIGHSVSPYCARNDTNNYIKVTASENLAFAADFEGRNVKNGVFTNEEGNVTGVITANASGNETIIVSAKVDGVELEPVTVNVTVTSNEPPAPAEPGEEISGTVTFGFGAEPSHLENLVTAPGYTAGSPAQVPVGTKITLSAEKEKDEYRFLYWKISGRFYSADNEITLNVARNTSVLAVYADVEYLETEKYKKIYFWNADKSYYSQISTPEEKLPYIPGGLEMTGMSFVGWYLDEETELTTDTLITELVTHAVAKYEPLDTEYTVKVNGEENKGKYNSPVSVSAPEAFTYWKLGEEKLSFRRAFEFFNYGNAEITSVFDESAKAIPTVVIEKSLGAAFITYDTPAGYERIEAGIIFGPTAEITVNSANSKANAQKTAAFGQFTAKPYDNEQYARGYQIFKKDGIVRVIYTNAIEMN